MDRVPLCTLYLEDGSTFDIVPTGQLPDKPPGQPLAVLAKGDWPKVATVLRAGANIVARAEV